MLWILALAFVYFATGWLGLAWAMEGGFATAVWPPSGIALAAVLVLGYRVLPGVWLGSLCVNLFSPNALGEDVTVTLHQAWTAAGVGLGATLQAAGGAYLVRRFVAFPDPLASGQKIIAFFVCAGPVSCLINALIGPSILAVSGAIDAADWPQTTWTWWSGDVLGVLIFTPMIAIWRSGSSVSTIARRATVSAVLALSFTLAIGAYAHVRALDRVNLLADLAHRAERIPQVTESAIAGHLGALGSIEGVYRAYGALSPQQFREVTSAPLTKFRGLHALSWNPRFADEQRPGVEALLHKDFGIPSLLERAPNGEMIPATRRPEYVAVVMIEPLSTNRRALGFDVLSNPVRRAALDRAMDTGEMVATGRITLVQKHGEAHGFLVFRPQYRIGEPTATVAQRRAAIAGYHTAVYMFREMLADALSRSAGQQFRIRLTDPAAEQEQRLLFANNLPGEAPANETAKPPTESLAASWSFPLAVPGGTWVLQVGITQDYVRAELRQSGWTILLAGLIICALIGALTLVGTGRQVELEHHVDERTRRLREEISAREEAERNLLQSQSLNVVGQMTGGIAHDFNNLLAVILGNVELLSPETEDDQESIDSIKVAAGRGAELTQRLLAFSRRQVLRPRPVDLAAMIDGMKGLLSRTLGETIAIETSIDCEVGCAIADPGPLENSLLNLAINARDAMPTGGRLRIGCRRETVDAAYCERNPDATPGEFVALSVTDSGLGMTREVLQRAFEPFFTTKDVGRGSGLGLSMVYGFAKQSGGHAMIESEVGVGTTVRVFLPWTKETPEMAERPKAEMASLGSGQRVLVIEDDDAVRRQVLKTLQRLGYLPAAAADVPAARQCLSEQTFDVVLSDVVLPGESGPAFARELERDLPDLSVIFMSGYAADSEMHPLTTDTVLLNKPIPAHELAKAMRLALARSHRTS